MKSRKVKILVTSILSLTLILTQVPIYYAKTSDVVLKPSSITEDGNLTEEGYEELKTMISLNGGYLVDDRVKKIEELMFERNEVVSAINNNVTTKDNDELYNRLSLIEHELQKLGVIDDVPQYIKESGKKENSSPESNEFEISAVNPGDYFDFYRNVINVSSYEASYTYNGVSYRYCTVYLSDKPSTTKYLSTIVNLNDYLVKGGMTNINQVNQYLLTGFKLAVKKANDFNPYVIAKVGINAIIAALPNVEPQYLYHGSNVHLIPYGSLEEFIRYIYVYDTAKDDWKLCGAGNYVKMGLDNYIFYKPYTSIQRASYVVQQYLYGNYNTLYIDSVAWFDYQKRNGVNYEPLDGVVKVADFVYEEGSTSRNILSIPLCADKYPAFINFFN